MGLFGRGSGGGMLNVIRCDEPEYLVWKWRPLGQNVNSTTRENAIRYGSSLRVKDGEVAVFVYRQKDGTMQDFIEGPFDDTIKTANFPVLASIVGMAFGGESPFQAEVYFINLANVIKINFGVPYFDVFDPRFLDSAVPISVGGSITFKINDAREFIKTHRLINFSLDDLKAQIKDVVTRRIKTVVSNCPHDNQIPVLQIERKIDDICDIIKPKLESDLFDYAVQLRRIDISRIDVDKESRGYNELRHITFDQQASTIDAQTAVNIKNMSDMQNINAMNLEDTLRIQREESQRAQRLQTESQYIGAHALNRQSDVMQTAASNLGGSTIGGASGSSGIDPAMFMTNMAVGGALGSQMAGMMNTMGAKMNNQWQQTASMQAPTPPPMPGTTPQSTSKYFVVNSGQQSGPFDMNQLHHLQLQGQFTPETLVWTQGMPQWAPASAVPELSSMFTSMATGMPQMPPPIP